MLKFKYFFAGIHSIGFARQHLIDGQDTFLIILSDGVKLIIARAKSQNNGTKWHQVHRDRELTQPDELIHALGSGVETAKKI